MPQGDHIKFAKLLRDRGELPNVGWKRQKKIAGKRWQRLNENEKENYRQQFAHENAAHPDQPIDPNADHPAQPIDANADHPAQPIDANADHPAQPIDANADHPAQPIDANADHPAQPIDANADHPAQPIDPNAHPDQPIIPIKFFDRQNCWEMLRQMDEWRVPMVGQFRDTWANALAVVGRPNPALYLDWLINLEGLVIFEELFGLQEGHGVFESPLNYFIFDHCNARPNLRFISSYESQSFLHFGQFESRWNLEGVEKILAAIYMNPSPLGGDAHWILAVVDLAKIEIRIYDSANNGVPIESKKLWAWHILSMIEKVGRETGRQIPPRDAWGQPKTQLNVPQQALGSSDCGIFMEMYALREIEQAQPDQPIDANADHPAQPIDANAHPAQPIDANAHPAQPIDANAHPAQPIDANAHPAQPIDANAHPDQPIDRNAQPNQPIDPNAHPDQPIDGGEGWPYDQNNIGDLRRIIANYIFDRAGLH